MTWSDPGPLGQPDEVGFGSSRPPRRPWPRPPRWPLILGGAAVIAVAVALALGRHPAKPAQAQGRAAVTVSQAGHRLLGVRAGWDLLGFGPISAVRVQFARGRVAQTILPALQSEGPVSFVAGPSQMIIRPWDFVPGYVIPDGAPPQQLSGALGHGGAALPGPRPDEVWVQENSMTLALARMDGRRIGRFIRLPADGWWLASANGRGGVLLSGVGEVYDVWPGGSRHIGGMLAAVGPTRWLTVDCYRPHRCTDVVIDPARGVQRQLGGLPVMSVSASSPGAIAPDGATAAVFRVTAGGQVSLHLLNLATGADQRVAVPLGQPSGGPGTLAWSPDSRWLFVLTAHGGLAAVNDRTRQVQSLGVRLPWLSQIAIREAPR